MVLMVAETASVKAAWRRREEEDAPSPSGEPLARIQAQVRRRRERAAGVWFVASGSRASDLRAR
eukprot:2771942-Rhodomonas_salina.1